ncbi:MAG: NUDIX domain-containing protein [Nanoarchaeota archaeon]|nr:NUDIX domain-containing protein [Nanoarchaeota archaeon]
MKTQKFRKAVFIVTYAKTSKGVEYLLLKRKLHWIGLEFPKGGIRFLESKKHAVKRELKEETGLKIKEIKKFNISGKYKYNRELPDRKGFVGQKYSLYAAEVKKEKPKLDKLEHSGCKWLTFKEAGEKLKWRNQKKCLKIVDKWLRDSKS